MVGPEGLCLHIPNLPELSEAHEKEIQNILEEKGALISIDSVNWPKNFPDNRETLVRTAHDTKNIYILFLATGQHLKAEVDYDLGAVANDSCVEFFVSPFPESGRYWNFEFNAIGKKNVSTRILRPEPRRLTPEELSRIRTIPSAGTIAFAEKGGLHKWSLLVKIPLNLIGIEYDGHAVAMKGNFYKCGAKTSSPHYLSWAPVDSEKPDFHRPEFFAPIILL